jgi:hypothetical protein
LVICVSPISGSLPLIICRRGAAFGQQNSWTFSNAQADLFPADLACIGRLWRGWRRLELAAPVVPAVNDAGHADSAAMHNAGVHVVIDRVEARARRAVGREGPEPPACAAVAHGVGSFRPQSLRWHVASLPGGQMQPFGVIQPATA